MNNTNNLSNINFTETDLPENNIEEVEDLSVYDFSNKIKQFETEPIKELDLSYIECIKGTSSHEQGEIASWLMRQYFAEKNKNNFWYNPTVTKETVLHYISKRTNEFPHTLSAVIEQHKLNKSLRSILGTYQYTDDLENEAPINMVGESTLKDIGAVVGNVSPTMVNKLTDKALGKYKRVYDLYHSSLGPKFDKYYNNLIDDLADSFATVFVEEETLEDALACLVADGIIKTKDLDYIGPIEFKKLDAIFAQSKVILFSELEEIFINDFRSVNRKISIFQYAMSRTINPDEKSGRRKAD